MQLPDLDLSRLADHPASAGLAGAIMSLRVVPGATWAERVFNVAGGVACAVYVGPLAAEWLKLASNASIMGLGFGLGAFGVTLADVIVKALRDLQLGAVITGWISRR